MSDHLNAESVLVAQRKRTKVPTTQNGYPGEIATNNAWLVNVSKRNLMASPSGLEPSKLH